MVDVDLSKVIKITVVPSYSLDLTFEKACRDCDLRYSRRDKSYSKKEDMYRCGSCATDIRRKHGDGKPFEIGIISDKVSKDYQKQAELQIEPEETSEEIPKATQDMFFVR
jgi:hypothetical protein